MPLSGPSEACFIAALMSSAVTSLSSMAVRSTMEPSAVGTRIAMPFIFPLHDGRTRPMAFAAPVLVGMMLTAAARARRRSLWTRSWTFWSFVYECTVVMKAFWSPKLSARTFVTGARQFVVHEALLRMLCVVGLYVWWFTPRTMVTSGSGEGALMRTFLAPAWRCIEAFSRLVKSPVDSTARYTPRSFHGSWVGSRSERTLRVFPLTMRSLPLTSTVPGNLPWVESYLRRCALVFTSARSFMATKSMFALRSMAAR